MAVTRNNIGNRALETLGVKSLNQPIDSNTLNTVLQIYDEFYAELESEALAEWGSTSDVPNEYSYHVINIVAYRLSKQMHVEAEQFQRLLADASASANMIRNLKSGKYVPTSNIEIDDF